MENRELQKLLEQYRDAAIGTGSDASSVNNACADEIHRLYKILCQHEPGKEGIAALMHDPNANVQLWSASHSLQWSPDAARSVLLVLRDSGQFPVSFTAQITLDEYEHGTLTFDY